MRKDLVREGEIATYHCWSRCVQRSCLCGFDPLTKRDFSYRRGWAENLLAYLAGVFAVDVGNYNLLSNHVHNILRTRPDIATIWSHEELALRWKLAWPEFRDGQWVREPKDQEIEELLAQPEKLEWIRRNLSSLSWFMARWKEPIAKVCNQEVGSSGHFWEARFGCRELLDDAAVISCCVYADLNQLRAGLANSLEESQYSAIYRRIEAAKQREAVASYEDFTERYPQGLYPFSSSDVEALFADCWLSPIMAGGPLLTADSLRLTTGEPNRPLQLWTPTTERQDAEDDVPVDAKTPDADDPQPAAEDTTTSPAESDTAAAGDDSDSSNSQGCSRCRRLTRRRASDAAILDIPWSEYLRVVQAVATLTTAQRRSADIAEAARDGPQAEAGTQLEEVLRRWGINPPAWLAQLEQLDHRCKRALGAPQRMAERAAQVAQNWLQGIRLCREIFRDRESDAGGDNSRADEFT